VRERYAVEGKWYSGIDLHKLWNAAKKVDPTLAWWQGPGKVNVTVGHQRSWAGAHIA
jgi:hypothetical protein